MLDNEPDMNSQTPSSSATPAETAPATTPPRRRRAASRPAGPPAPSASAPVETPPVVAPPVEAPTADAPAAEATPAQATPAHVPPLQAPADDSPPVGSAPTAEPLAAEPPAPTWDAPTPTGDGEATAAESTPPAKKAAKRAPAKRTAKKVAASEDEAPRTRAPRKRAAKKTATPLDGAETAQAQPDLLAEPALVTESIAPTNDIPNPFATAEPVEETALQGLPDSGADLAQGEPAAPTDEPKLTVTVETPMGELVPDDDEVEPTVEPFGEDEPAAEATGAAEPESTDDSDSDDTTDDSEDSDDSEAEASDDDSGDGSRRRRRRRGGRRRRRTGGDDDSDSDQSGETEAKRESSDDDPAGEPSEATADATESSDGDDDGKGESDTQRRRRRRRRRGEDAGSAPDDPTEVVVRVREPRRTPKVNNEVTGIEGSTRMEAKRQRRRDGREAGRRRPPILSEAEFLARREAVSRKMIIRQHEDLTQIAVLEDNILVEHYVDRDSAASLIGNVYLGRVQNVLPSMEAAFIDIGRGRNAVVYAGEIDWDSFGAEGQNRKVEKVLKSGQTILVQVSKDPIGAKGARLTNHVSIPGRYIVYAPGGHLSGISRKLPDVERKRLRDVLADLVPESASVIVRTAAEGASEDELIRDVNRLKAQWEDIERKVASGSAPQLLYGEPDLTVRIVRDLFTEDFSELIIDGNGGPTDAYDAVDGYVSHVAPHLKERIRRWESEDGRDVFASYRLDEQIAKALERKVFLPSGGSLVIDRTEAMTVIDVNTGKFTGSGGNLEATVTSNNLEAAEEIVRQLRLRDVGGIIVIDFIDMVLPNNRELLLRRLVECLSRDRTRHQVAEVTSLGLVQMTRKKIGTGLLEAFTSECSHCNGRGVELHDMPVESQKQADGGAREPRPRDQRRGGGSNGGGSNGGGSNGGGSNGPKPTQPTKSPDHSPENGDSGANGDSNDTESSEDRPSRSRRGGRSRRGAATREQGAPVESDQKPEQQQEPQSEQEPVPVS